MGRLAARRLVEAGCRVSMTVRRYRHGEVSLPDGVEAVSYEERLSLLPRVRLVVSATASPHYTLRAAEVGPALAGPTVFCDLAVPRDIDPAIASLPGARVYDTDGICGGADARRDEAALTRAREILADGLAEFARWYGFRAVVPAARETGELAARDFMGRWKRLCAASDSPGRRRRISSTGCGLRRKRRSTGCSSACGRRCRPSCGSPVWTRCIWPPEGAPNPRGRAILSLGPRPGGTENAPRFPLFVDLTNSKIRPRGRRPRRGAPREGARPLRLFPHGDRAGHLPGDRGARRADRPPRLPGGRLRGLRPCARGDRRPGNQSRGRGGSPGGWASRRTSATRRGSATSFSRRSYDGTRSSSG